MLDLLRVAARVALSNSEDNIDHRYFLLGCIGIREDGTLVHSKNGAQYYASSKGFKKNPTAHAEGRLLRKLGRNGVIYVSRVKKNSGEIAMAMPCIMCQHLIKAKGVVKVYYTIDSEHYGVWIVKNNVHRIYKTKEFIIS